VDTRIVGRPGAQNRGRFIGRAVIDRDDLDVLEALRLNRCDRIGQVLRRVATRQQDRDARRAAGRGVQETAPARVFAADSASRK
jgi:hypothetical protein